MIPLLEPLESRTLFSTSTALFIFQEPLPSAPAFSGHPPPPPPLDNPNRYPTALDISPRSVPGGIYLTVSVSSTYIMPLAPTGSIELFDGARYLATVNLGSSLHIPTLLTQGTHTLTAIYSGDANFLPIQSSETLHIKRAPADAQPNTNDAGERSRPTRQLSNINFFDNLYYSVAAIPTPSPGSTPGAASGPIPPGPPTPRKRFSTINFSAKVPHPSISDHNIFALLRQSRLLRG